MSNYSVQWYEILTPARARDILSPEHWDYCMEQGKAWCMSRARGWWDANNPEYHAAYTAAATVASERRAVPHPWTCTGCGAIEAFSTTDRDPPAGWCCAACGRAAGNR